MMRMVLIALLVLTTGARAQTVFAAASLAEAMHDLADAWKAAGHKAPTISTAASSALARQIEAGAGAGIFASADEQWMDELERAGLLAPETRRDVLGNDLVLIVPKDRARTVALAPGLDVDAVLGPARDGGRLALADPRAVPAGIYAKQALTKLGAWSAVENRIAVGDSVRGALLLVERGEASAGVVYATDAAVAPDVAVAGTFPADSHDPIRYPFAILKAGDTPATRALFAYVTGPEGKRVFAARGFKVD